MKTLLILTLTIILSACAPKGFDQKNVRYPGSSSHLNEDYYCQRRFEHDLYEMSFKQTKCFEAEYKTKNIWDKVFASKESYNCPTNKFLNLKEVANNVENCQAHMRSPNYKKGKIVSLSKNSEYEDKCKAFIFRPSYSLFGEAKPTYHAEISCDNKVIRTDEVISETDIKQ